tara:strand:+ start:653 stop:868 length:216 start_codon:yes stop_codon:yes gene_type:complete
MIVHVVADLVVPEATTVEVTTVEVTTVEVAEAVPPIIIKTSPLRVEAHLHPQLPKPAFILKPKFRRTELCL